MEVYTELCKKLLRNAMLGESQLLIDDLLERKEFTDKEWTYLVDYLEYRGVGPKCSE